MPRSLSDLFGRYSLPNVMGRLGHRIGGLFHHGDNGGITPPDFNQGHYNVDPTGGLTQNTYTPGQFGISDPFTTPNVGGEVGNYGGVSDPFGGGFLGGMSGNSGGSQWGGTLGGGSVVDPSQWGQFGLGGEDVGNSVPQYTRYATGMGDGGPMTGGRGLLGTGFFRQHHMGTGGPLPAQGGYDSSGINPGGGALPGTGGPAQVHQVGGMQTGGNLPARQMTGMLGRLGGKQPPGGLMR